MRNIFKLELRDKAKRKPTFCFVSTVQRLEMQAQSMEMCYANFFADLRQNWLIHKCPWCDRKTNVKLITLPTLYKSWKFVEYTSSTFSDN